MKNIFIYIIIGFFAQMIDGTMGMAYGVSCRSFLRTAAGLPSATASAVVHCAEIPLTLVSGISHISLKNVSKELLFKLLLPGVLGGVLGAWLLSDIGDKLEPFIDVYLVIMGIIILIKAFGKKDKKAKELKKAIYPLGFVGGFLDATGGGGWGPVVTSTLVASNHDVRKSIGTVNTAEFLVTVAETTAFAALATDFKSYVNIIAGLVIGGIIAAPISAYLCKKIPVKPLMIIVGILIVALNCFNIYKLFA